MPEVTCNECGTTYEEDECEIQTTTCPGCGHETMAVPYTDLMV